MNIIDFISRRRGVSLMCDRYAYLSTIMSPHGVATESGIGLMGSLTDL